MIRFIAFLAVGVITMLNGAAARAGLIDFTLGDSNENTMPLPATYQPLSGQGITLTYLNVSTYNAAPDYTSGLADTDNYFVYPSSGNEGTMTFGFSTNVTIPSFYYANFDATGGVDAVVNAYDGPLGTGNDLTPGGIDLTPSPSDTNGAPVFVLSTALASLSAIRSVTFSTNGNDAVNIDNITANPVPEPASLVLAGLGFAGLGFAAPLLAARRRRQA